MQFPILQIYTTAVFFDHSCNLFYPTVVLVCHISRFLFIDFATSLCVTTCLFA